MRYVENPEIIRARIIGTFAAAEGDRQPVVVTVAGQSLTIRAGYPLQWTAEEINAALEIKPLIPLKSGDALGLAVDVDGAIRCAIKLPPDLLVETEINGRIDWDARRKRVGEIFEAQLAGIAT